MSTEKAEGTPKVNVEELKWMVRSCDTYEDEYDNCTNIKSRFHQYFIHGDTYDCNPWKNDLKNCEKWLETRDNKFLEELVISEQKRREKRLRPHFANTIWKKRESPPEDWAKELPPWFEERSKTSYLAVKAAEIKSGNLKLSEERTLCVIS